MRVIGRAVGTLQRGLAACSLTLAASASAWACGFDDPNSAAVQRGMMNLVFPQSAWVRTAIWQAQMAGDLPRDALALRDDLTPQARGQMQLMRATWLLKSLAARLGAATGAGEQRAVSVVLMGPMLWSRIETGFDGVHARVHVSGPATGDVVLVTDTPALEAIVDAGMGFEQALGLGLARLYGPAAQVGAAQAWLDSQP